MKVFVSQPMAGKTAEELWEKMYKVKAYLERCYQYKDIQLIDNIFYNELDKPVKLLGKAVSMMAEADLVVFVTGWEEARGCEVEHRVAKNYNIPYLFC